MPPCPWHDCRLRRTPVVAEKKGQGAGGGRKEGIKCLAFTNVSKNTQCGQKAIASLQGTCCEQHMAMVQKYAPAGGAAYKALMEASAGNQMVVEQLYLKRREVS